MKDGDPTWQNNFAMSLRDINREEEKELQKALEKRKAWEARIREDDQIIHAYKVNELVDEIGNIIKATGKNTFGRDVKSGIHMPQAMSEVPDFTFAYIRWDITPDKTMCREIACGVFRSQETNNQPVGFRVLGQKDIGLFGSRDQLGLYLSENVMKVQRQEKRNRVLIPSQEHF